MKYKDSFGSYQIDELPGNREVGVSNNVFIHEQYRGKGFGKLQHEQRLLAAALPENFLNYLICTVNKDNKAEIHILATHGWKVLDEFVSSDTAHTIQIWGRKVGRMTHEQIVK